MEQNATVYVVQDFGIKNISGATRWQNKNITAFQQTNCI